MNDETPDGARALSGVSLAVPWEDAASEVSSDIDHMSAALAELRPLPIA